MDEQTFYTSAEVARQLGISDATLRSWKSRHAERLPEGESWVKNSDGSTLWTEAGLLQLQRFRNGSVARGESDATPPLHDATEALQDRYTPLVDAVADALTPQLLQRIDQRVMTGVRDAIATPMSSSECVAVLQRLGLKPADPATLLGSGSNAGLLAASDTNDDNQ